MSRLRRSSALCAAAALLLATAACGESGSPTEEAGGLEGVEVTGEFGEAPAVTVADDFSLDETSSEQLVEGDGVPLVTAQPALLHLTLVNARTGEPAISTYDQGSPLYLQQFDDSQLFEAIVEALDGAATGSRFVLGMVPADLYGEQGNPELGIEGEDTVIAVADVVSGPPEETLEGPDGESVDPPEGTPEVVEEDGAVTGIDFADASADPPGELTVIPLIEGEGPEARDGSVVTFDYLGQVYGSGDVFDESFSREPSPFGLGVGGLIQAWDEGLVGVKRGSRVMIIAPSDTAYGDQDKPEIPAGSTLVFVIDVLGVS
ncbi:MAG: FKBP-type peptidyl-prolyl cis-trans isomerase [Nocardioides sp.]|nr:FKBP-type peptidyl-prolyl cis-trans isomerase [Nocardioides sp.]